MSVGAGEPVLELHDVVKRYPGDVEALRGVHLSVERGELWRTGDAGEAAWLAARAERDHLAGQDAATESERAAAAATAERAGAAAVAAAEADAAAQAALAHEHVRYGLGRNLQAWPLPGLFERILRLAVASLVEKPDGALESLVLRLGLGDARRR